MSTQSLIENAARNLTDGLVVLDAQARVAFQNFPAEQILGAVKTADEFIGQLAARTTMPEILRDRLQAALVERMVDHAVEMQLAAPVDGAIIAARFFPVCDESGVDIGTGIVLRDMTRVRTADAMKSQLLSTVSHELRTPLASIKGFATTLLRHDVKWDEATQRDFLRIIEEESDRLTELIDNLLDMSQIEAGALRISKEPVQLRQLIRQVVDGMRMRTESHYFVVDLPAEMPRVLADQRRIRQVLTNLIGNAIKYTKRGQITIACESEPHQVLISVSDQGEGIPPAMLDKIFERFFQVDGASTRRVGGSGLGLSISRGIIEAHSGKLWAESTVGQGTTFRFTLPLAEE